jgi:hypothetical protein
MAIGFVLGVSLIVAGLVLLSHLSYTSLTDKKTDDPEEAPAIPGRKESAAQSNDCFLPFCFFQVARITNHETWIVACLLSGSFVLLLSLVPAQS